MSDRWPVLHLWVDAWAVQVHVQLPHVMHHSGCIEGLLRTHKSSLWPPLFPEGRGAQGFPLPFALGSLKLMCPLVSERVQGAPVSAGKPQGQPLH